MRNRGAFGAPQDRRRSSEHASTAKLYGNAELGRVGVCASLDRSWARTEPSRPSTKLAFITCGAGEVKLGLSCMYARGYKDASAVLNPVSELAIPIWNDWRAPQPRAKLDVTSDTVQHPVPHYHAGL